MGLFNLQLGPHELALRDLVYWRIGKEFSEAALLKAIDDCIETRESTRL